jgi:hypothetical protein
VELNTRYLDRGHVRHAYALTGHAGQGATVQRAFVLGHDRGRLQEWGYVALSRAREATRIYVAEPFEPSERVDRGAVAAHSALERLTASLESSGREKLAILSADARRAEPTRPVWQPQPAQTTTARERLRAIEQERRTLVALRRRAPDRAEVDRRLADLDQRAIDERRTARGPAVRHEVGAPSR